MAAAAEAARARARRGVVRAVVGWAVARAVVDWEVERAAVKGAGYSVDWVAVGWARVVGVVAAVAVCWAVPDQRAACWARTEAGRGWAARAAVARAVVVREAARAAAGWAGAGSELATWVEVVNWEAASTAVAARERWRARRGRVHSWYYRVLRHRNRQSHRSRKSRAICNPN